MPGKGEHPHRIHIPAVRDGDRKLLFGQAVQKVERHGTSMLAK
jgi:hypothetical protein